MPLVVMPDGTRVNMPDKLDSATAARLKSVMSNKKAAPAPAPSAPPTPAPDAGVAAQWDQKVKAAQGPQTPFDKVANVSVGAASELMPGGKAIETAYDFASDPVGYMLKSNPKKDLADIRSLGDPNKIKQTEDNIYKGFEDAIGHPAATAMLMKSGIADQWTHLIAGPGQTEKEQREWGKVLADAGTEVTGLLAVARAGGKVVQTILEKQEMKAILEAQKAGNTEKVKQLLRDKTSQLKSDIERSRALSTSKHGQVKERLAQHQERVSRTAQEHADRVASLDSQIAEAKKALDEKRVSRLTEIRDRLENDKKGALDRERDKLVELHQEHERVVQKANSEYEAAKKAAEDLASERSLKMSSSDRQQRKRLIDAYNKRIASNEARSAVGLPVANGLGGVDAKSNPLGATIVDRVTERHNRYKEAIQNSPIYKNFEARVAELRGQGKKWGRDSEPGMRLRKSLRDMMTVPANAGESDISTYKRRMAARLLPLLEQEPAPVMVDGPMGGVTKQKQPAVPVRATEALDVLRDIKADAWRMKTKGDTRYHELLDLVGMLESAITDFVGEEHMPMAKWRDLMAPMNELVETDVGDIAIGRKGGDYLKPEQQNRNVPMENVEGKVFGNSDSILNYRRILANEEEFYVDLDQHLANELSGKSSSEVLEWMKKGGKWVDHINEPGLRNRLESYAAALKEQEGHFSESSALLKRVEDRVGSAEADLKKALDEITADRNKKVAEAGKARDAAVTASKENAARQKPQIVSERKTATLTAEGQARKETEDLEKALAPDAQGLGVAKSQRRKTIADRKSAKAQEGAEGTRLRIEADKAKSDDAALKETHAARQKIVDRLQSVMDSGSPIVNRAKFRKIAPDLVSSGVMSQQEAAEIEALLTEDAENYAKGKATQKSKAKMRKWAGLFVAGGVTAAGFGAVSAVSKHSSEFMH